MRLCFLLERQYAPYPKWFGTAFQRLACAPSLTDDLRRAQLAATWQERESHLCAAYEVVAAMHNRLAITEPLPARARPFWGRPFRVIGGERFAAALRVQITDPAVVERIAERGLIRGQRPVQRLHRPAVRSGLASRTARAVRLTGNCARIAQEGLNQAGRLTDTSCLAAAASKPREVTRSGLHLTWSLREEPYREPETQAQPLSDGNRANKHPLTDRSLLCTGNFEHALSSEYQPTMQPTITLNEPLSTTRLRSAS